MTVLEQAHKVDCSTEFFIKKCDNAWTEMRCRFNDNIFDCIISYIGKPPSALIDALYVFSCYANDFEGNYLIECNCANIKVDETASWCVEAKAKFSWDEEGAIVWWTFSRDLKDFKNENFILNINVIKEDSDENFKYNFRASYRDMCYAVSKCFTNYLKEHGIRSYNLGTYEDDINIRRLLIIKGYALGILTNGINDDNSLRDNYNLTFAEELELLQMDM